jgi:mannitol/fructose-specific phosphotransferase system IIA component (Ntr-type)
MKIANLLNVHTVRPLIAGSSKTEILQAVIDLAAKNDRVLDAGKMGAVIFEREKIMSTGVGSGFAIPHGKTDAVSDVVGAFATTAEPIEYQSLDGQPVRLVFLLVGRENMVGPHIKLLARISRMMNKEEFRNKLLEAETPEAIIETFREEEATYAEG